MIDPSILRAAALRLMIVKKNLKKPVASMHETISTANDIIGEVIVDLEKLANRIEFIDEMRKE